MELFATFGVAGKELFEYNRDYYTFDQKQRMDREMLRLEMQIKRFDLFRDDIRDLIELTTSKMEMYHMVGALVLEFCVLIYTEGAELAWIAPAPPFAKALYAMSLASAFIYILLAVWLSMHASVSAHSFGVRLLTRYVRLPIPGVKQVTALNARLTDFERQGTKQMLRVPFVGEAQQWQRFGQRRPGEGEEGKNDGDDRFKPALRDGTVQQDLLDKGEMGINDHDLTDAATKLPGHHIQLFRRLQAKWQCYDCYARVCMSLGAYHILCAISYYLIIATMSHYHDVTTAFCVITVFMVCNVVVGILDVGRHLVHRVTLLHVFGAIPVYLAAITMASTIRMDVLEHHLYPYPYSPVIFFLAAIYHEGLLHVAWPSSDGRSLPSRFRTVLFIDVFAVADEALRNSMSGQEEQKPAALGVGYSEEDVLQAEEGLFAAESALRRWQAVPSGTSEARAQSSEIAQVRRQLLVSRKMLNGEAARLAGKIGDKAALSMIEIDRRGWHELEPEEQAEDPYAGSLLGPFQHSAEGNSYYYDLEAREFVWTADERQVITLADLAGLVRTAEQLVRRVLGGKSDDYDSADDLEEDVEADQSTSATPNRGGSMLMKTAGSSNGNYIPHRLPWKVVAGMTRVLQLAWIFCGVQFAWEQSHFPGEDRMDKYLVAEERRRLGASSSAWSFEPLEASFPTGPFFRASSLSCLSDVAGRILVSGDDGSAYRVDVSSGGAVAGENETALAGRRGRRLEALSPFAFPGGAVALCADAPSAASRSMQERDPVPENASAPCLMGQLTERGIAFWPLGSDRGSAETVELPVEGRPWQLLAGAAVRCEAVSGLLDGLDVDLASWCLLLAGWDGRHLPIAAVPLPRGLDSPPDSSSSVSPAFAAPLSALRVAPPSEAAVAVASLSLEPRRGRLWALLSDGALQAWELLGEEPMSLGRWTPPLPGQRLSSRSGGVKQQVVGICEDTARSELLLAARGGDAAGHRLFRAPLPRALLA
eukprot:CAMPEP_0203840066 /NCGR_PEP_ID=MMETSP0359-20131031/553_1 /ASSEMBLY_ACC=CAM_ASM_000338 /TAXON_ID=268821 /ORGANISM="Scrippsiella Hangoei, Strain SHTV-5" /LENGTH=989 /DNA_ID=CAMNT_0050754213 /DNA_START=71 /DNA_END=3037 /DNA_ORIENTATION=-